MVEGSEEFGAVAVRGVVTYDLSTRDGEYLELRNVREPHQFVLIHVDALRGLVSILTKAEQQLSSHRE